MDRLLVGIAIALAALVLSGGFLREAAVAEAGVRVQATPFDLLQPKV